MRARTSALLLFALTTACEVDLTGLGDALCLGGCYAPPAPTLAVSGSVSVGPYAALEGEVEIRVYAPTDTVNPVRSAISSSQSYFVDFGPYATTAVCGYVARAVRWDGASTAVQPLLSTRPDSCPVQGHLMGADFELPAYAPLDEPFALEGEVWIGGRAARAGEALVRLAARDSTTWQTSVTLETDELGAYRLETTDRAQGFGYCRLVAATATLRADSTTSQVSSLAPIDPSACLGGRRLPDLRFGQMKAATGRIYVLGGTTFAAPAAGATVALLSPADSSVVGPALLSHDDGSFHAWYPASLEQPNCDMLLRVELEGFATQIRTLVPSPTSACSTDLWHTFELRP